MSPMRKARIPIALSFLTFIVLAEFCLGGVRKDKTIAVRSPLNDERNVHVLFGFDTPETGIFPSDVFTVADDSQKTKLRTSFRFLSVRSGCRTARTFDSLMCLMALACSLG